MPKPQRPTNPSDDKWYGEESSYTATDEILIDDRIPVFDRGRDSDDLLDGD